MKGVIMHYVVEVVVQRFYSIQLEPVSRPSKEKDVFFLHLKGKKNNTDQMS